ncbi:MAG: molybdenum cofactor biosynthesis protein MoaE [Pseudomonadota bacterium]
MHVRVTSAPFDPGHELTHFTDVATGAGAGAVVSFTGIVRNDTGDLVALEIEHYPGMTQKALMDHAQAAIDRFGLTDALVIHRFGHVPTGETIMMVATAARHRKDAFQGADFLMDYLKSRAPFWKKEITSKGTSWVAAKDSDEDALLQWGTD